MTQSENVYPFLKDLCIHLEHPLAKIPVLGSSGSCGYDLYSVESRTLLPGQRHIFETGVSIEFPPHLGGFIWPRSGLAVKEGAMVMAGLIDSDYRGTLKVALYNASEDPLEIRKGDRVGQIVFQPYCHMNLKVAESSKKEVTSRGSNGFGSTGKK